MTTLIVAASAFCAGIAGGFLLAAWLSHTWVRTEGERRKRFEDLLEECSWYQSADYVHLGK